MSVLVRASQAAAARCRARLDATRLPRSESSIRIRAATRVAFSNILSNTGARLPGEELMTSRTSGRRCLLLQRLAQIVCAFAHSLAARVLDGDHGLLGEVGEKG